MSLVPRALQRTKGKIEPLTRPSSQEEGGEEKGDVLKATNEMAAPTTITATLMLQQGASFAAAAAPISSHHAAAGAAEAAATLQATSTSETTETATTQTAAAITAAAAPTATADLSVVLDAQAKSEAVSSTLMGIALLAYLQGSAAKHEGSGAGDGGCGSSATPSSSHRGGTAAARPVVAGAHPHEQLPPRRYQRMSPQAFRTPKRQPSP